MGKEAVATALRAFESVLNAICDARGWARPQNATVTTLIDTVLSNDLIPPYLQSHFRSLHAAMKDGLPSISNRNVRHGQGAEEVIIPEPYVAYALHLNAANIAFLVEAHRAIPLVAGD